MELLKLKVQADYGIKYTGIDGLTIGAAAGTDDTAPTATVDITNMYVTYAMDAFSVGYQTSEE